MSSMGPRLYQNVRCHIRIMSSQTVRCPFWIVTCLGTFASPCWAKFMFDNSSVLELSHQDGCYTNVMLRPMLCCNISPLPAVAGFLVLADGPRSELFSQSVRCTIPLMAAPRFSSTGPLIQSRLRDVAYGVVQNPPRSVFLPFGYCRRVRRLIV